MGNKVKNKIEILDFLEKWPVVFLPLIVLFLIPFTVYSQPQSVVSKATTPEYSASLLLSPASGTVPVGELLEVSILLETGEAKVDGADAILRYNPQMLKVVELKKGGLFEEYIQESVDEVQGEIHLSGLTFDPRPKTGTLGTILFEPLTTGTTTVFFEFTPGATKGDSNVALTGSGGVDILEEVQNAKYVIE